MLRRLGTLLAGVSLVVCGLSVAGQTPSPLVTGSNILQEVEQRTGLFVAPFAGEQPLAAKAATVLHLQIWQTLRAAPPNNTRGLSFGRGIVQWAEWTPPTLHSEALAQLQGTASQMVLWGQVQPLGKGVVIQAYLSVAPNSTAPASPLWRLALPELGEGGAIALGLPAAMFEFEPIVLRLDSIPLLNSHIGNSPANVPIYADKTFKREVGVTGGDFRATEQGRDYSKVVSGSVSGWISIPGLSAARSEVSDFAGGLIRIQRRDWGGAIDLLQLVVANKNAPVNIRVSSYLLMAVASRFFHEQVGAPDRSLEFVEAAERLNPLLRETIKYKCMVLLAQRTQPSAVALLDKTVQTSGYLFPKDDPWLGKVKSVVRSRLR